MKREEILKKLEYGIEYFPHDVVQEAIRWKDEILLSARAEEVRSIKKMLRTFRGLI
jgi:hypothetical protein